MHSLKKLKRDEQNNDSTESKCPDSYTQTEKSNSNKQKDDKTKDEDLNSPVQTSASYTENEKIYNCLICNDTFATIDELKIHMDEEEKEEKELLKKPFWCECGKKFKYEECRDFHQTCGCPCHPRKEYKCSEESNSDKKENDESSADEEESANESGTESNASDDDYVCSTCKEMFDTKTDFDKHMRQCCISSTLTLCTLCYKQFTREEYLLHLKFHVREMRILNSKPPSATSCTSCIRCASCTKKEKIHECDVCYKRFAAIYQLEDHVAFRKMRLENPYRCQCGARFKCKERLLDHVRACSPIPDNEYCDSD